MPPPSRLASLDGLRGVAALVVVLHHAVLLDPAQYAAIVTPERQFETFSARWWSTYTPLHLAWAGNEAVAVFFVLSGVVLTLMARRPGFSWRRYYPARLARLYPPVWATVALAAVSIALVPRAADLGNGWLDGRPRAYDLRTLVLDSTLVGGWSDVVGPLWSLQWEVWFSLLLPVYLLCRRAGPRAAWALAGAAAAVSGLGGVTHHPSVQYLPMFALGVLLATHADALRARCAGWSDARWGLVLVASLGLLLTQWLVPAVAGRRPDFSSAFEVVGAAGVVAGCWFWAPAARLLTRRPVAWLGRISFSLYLVHDIVLVGWRYAVPAASPWAVMPLAVASAIAAGWAFFRLVERPLHHLARRLR